MSSMIIRDAKPTHDEGLEYARFVDMASEGGIRKALGKRYSEIIASAYMVENHDLSYQNAVFAEVDGDIAGMASAFPAGGSRDSTNSPLRIAPGNRLRRSVGLAILGVFFRMISSHREGEYYLEFLAVDEAFQGQGVGTQLLKVIEDRARDFGASTYALDVSAKNAGAQKLYERTGFSVEYVLPKSRVLPEMIRRMTKEI